MKKFIAIIAAIALIATMSVSAFAATLNDETAATGVTSPVSANYVDDQASKPDEIWLDVEWTDVEFTYTTSGKVWDETAMAWVDNAGSWTDDEATVDVASRSSKQVVVTVAYTQTAVKAAFDKTTATLAAADGAAVEDTFVLTVADDAAAITADATAGTIKVTVA